MKPEQPGLVKLFTGILYSDDAMLNQAINAMIKSYGRVDYTSPIFEFDLTDYYVPEMGSPIQRQFVAFERLINPKEIAQIKVKTNEIESAISSDGNRKVNLDPGYMDYDKVVLASAKYNGQKVYLDLGIWADLTLRFEKNRFHPYPWSFPDFKTGMYEDVFLEIRGIYKIQRKEG